MGATNLRCTIAGVPGHETHIRKGTMTVQDNLNESPNMCSFTYDRATAPPIGSEIEAHLGDTVQGAFSPEAYYDLAFFTGVQKVSMFGGVVLTTEKLYESTIHNTTWYVTCEDQTYWLNLLVPTGTFTGPADVVVQTLYNRFTSGLSGTLIQPSLPTVTITFDGTRSLNECLTTIANLVGAYWYIDYGKVLHFFQVEATQAPESLAPGNVHALVNPPLTYTIDLSQVRTRVYVRGASSSVTIQNDQTIVPGSSIIPVDDSSHFSTGTVMDPLGNIIHYTGTEPGNIATTALGVAGNPGTANATQWLGPSPPAGGNLNSGAYIYKLTYVSSSGETETGAPFFATIPAMSVPGSVTATLSRSSGRLLSGSMDAGTYQYRVAYRTNSGDTLPGPVASVNISPVSGPGALPTATVSGAGSLGAGIYLYTVAFTTTTGETQVGPAVAVTIGLIGTPGSCIATVRTSGGSSVVGNLTTGTYSYKIAFRTASGGTSGQPGETVPGPPAQVTISAIQPPVTPSVSVISGAAGNMQSGTYTYGISFRTGNGETVLGATTTVTITQVATPNSPGVAAVSGVSGNLQSGGNYQYRVSYLTSNGETLPGPTTSVSIPAVSVPGALAPSPSFQTGGLLYPGFYSYRVTFVTPNGETLGGPTNFVTIPSITTPTIGGRAPLQGGQLGPGTYVYAVAFISALGVTAVTAVNQSSPVGLSGVLTGVNIFGITTSSDPRVTGRALYRSLNGQPFQIIAVFDNASTNYVDTGYSAVGAFASTTDTASYGSISLTAIPTSSDLRVVARKIYRTYRGGGEYHLVQVINDRTTTSFLDNVSDANLGAAPPLLSTADNGQVQVSNISVSGDARVQRRAIFRTMLGGGIFYRIAILNDNITTSFVDNFADSAILGGGVPVAVSTANNGQVFISSIPNSVDTRVSARIIYRTYVNGGTFLQLTTIGSASVTTFIDNTNDNSLTGNPPVLTDTANNGQVNLTNIPISGDARVTQRVIYRAKQSVSDYSQIAVISNNTATTFTDNSGDSNQPGDAPLTEATTNNGQVTLSNIPLPADGRVTSRAIYRTKANGSVFYRLTTVSIPQFDPEQATYTDNVPDSHLVGDPPVTVSTANNGKVDLTAIPSSLDPRITGRVVYRTKANGSDFYQLVTLQNTTLTHTDNTNDDSLTGDQPPTVNTADNGRMQIFNIPLGPTGTTSRRIYRTKVNGSDFYRAATINNTTTDDPTTYIDNTSDDSLSDLAPTVTGLRTERGSSTLNVKSTVGFPIPGWIRADSQVIYYSGISGNTLTGIPGIIVGSPSPTNDIVTPGAIISPIAPADVAVVSMGMLTGVTNITTGLNPGDRLTLWVQRDDLAAQAAMIVLEGGNGIHEHTISDETWSNVTQCNKAGDADLLLFSTPLVSLAYDSRDTKLVSGRTLHVALPAPLSLTGDLKVQSVRISEIDVAPNTFPRYSARVSSIKFTLQDLLRRVSI